MINLILMAVQNTESLEKATGQIDSLEKQVTELQDTIISIQNDKISSLTGDIGAIVGVFGLIFAVLSLLSAVAIIYIQAQNKKATESMKEAKELAQQARDLNEAGNNINKDAANELKEVQKKVREMEILIVMSKSHNIASARYSNINTNIAGIRRYTESHQDSLPEEMILRIDKRFTQHEINDLSFRVNLSFKRINTAVQDGYKIIEESINHKDFKELLDIINDNLDKLQKFEEESAMLYKEASNLIYRRNQLN